MARLAPAERLPQGEQSSLVPGGSCKNPSFYSTLAAFCKRSIYVFTNIYLSGNRGKLRQAEILGMSWHRPASEAGQEHSPEPAALLGPLALWVPSTSNQCSLRFPIYPDTCKDGPRFVLTYHLFPSVFPGEREPWFTSSQLKQQRWTML